MKYNRARVVVEHESQPWTDKDLVAPVYNCDVGDVHYPPGQRARAALCECHRCTDLANIKEIYIHAAFSNYDAIDPKTTTELSEHQYLLCAPYMYGFILKDRTYGNFTHNLVRRMQVY
jgi:hypothetical protein